jgi:hypothetical protein
MAPLYAVAADYESFVEGWTTTNSAALDRLLERAERDVDSIVGPWGFTTTVGSHTLPTTTITVASVPQQTPTTGTIIVAGQSVTYTGITSTTFTGTAGGTGEVPAGSPVYRRAASGLKFDPLSQLTSVQALALKRATCAQAEYRFEMGEEFFVQAQYGQVSGPDFSQTGKLPRVGPTAVQELQGYGLLLESPVG